MMASRKRKADDDGRGGEDTVMEASVVRTNAPSSSPFSTPNASEHKSRASGSGSGSGSTSARAASASGVGVGGGSQSPPPGDREARESQGEVDVGPVFTCKVDSTDVLTTLLSTLLLEKEQVLIACCAAVRCC